MIANYLLLLMLTKRPIVAPTLDDIIGKDRDYTKPIPHQNIYGETLPSGHVFWIDLTG